MVIVKIFILMTIMSTSAYYVFNLTNKISDKVNKRLQYKATKKQEYNHYVKRL